MNSVTPTLLYCIVISLTYSSAEFTEIYCDRGYLENATLNYVAARGSLDDHWGDEVLIRRPSAKQDLVVYSGANLKELCQFPMEKVREVVLVGVGVEYVERGVFRRTEEPYTVQLQNNRLTAIDAGVFSESSILALDLSNNNIQAISSSAFDNMIYLEVIRINNNQIQLWDNAWFTNTPNIHQVELSRNYISSLPANMLGHIKGMLKIKDTTLYSNLNVSSNRISFINPAAFLDQDVFGKIDLGKNEIAELSPELFGHFATLFAVGLSYNPVRCFSEKTLSSWTRIEVIELTGVVLREECNFIMQRFRKEHTRPLIYW